MSNGAAQASPAPAHDPIAIAALIAELPELEAQLEAARKVVAEHSDVMRQKERALNAMQQRIDGAMKALRDKAPKNSVWKSGDFGGYSQEQVQEAMQKIQLMQLDAQKKAALQGLQNPLAPPPMIKKGGPYG